MIPAARCPLETPTNRHFKIQIDTVAPEPFAITFLDGKETENPRPTILFHTTDSLSGIDYYKMKIGEGDASSISGEQLVNDPYTLPPQAPGKRSILIHAIDKAGNDTIATEEFTITPLKEPTLTDYPEQLESGAILTVKGKTQYANSDVVVWLQREKGDPKRFIVQSDADGKFTFTADERPRDGIYQLWTEVIDDRGAKSNPSGKVTFIIAQSAVLKIGTRAVTIFSLIIPLVALILLLLMVIWYGLHKFSRLRKRLLKEIREADIALHDAFDSLKEDIRKQVKMLERAKTKRGLSQGEEKIIKQLRKNLDAAEKFVKKEIEDIEKVVK